MAQSFVVGDNAMSDKVGSACVHVTLHPCMCIIFKATPNENILSCPLPAPL